MPPRLLLVGGGTEAAPHRAVLDGLAADSKVTWAEVDAAGDWPVALGEVDAVVACGGAAANARTMAEALRVGLPVLVVGALAPTAVEAGELAAAAARTHGVAMAGCHWRFRPGYRWAAAASSELGPATTFFARTDRTGLVEALDLAVACLGPPAAFTVGRPPAGAHSDGSPATVQLHGAGGAALLVVGGGPATGVPRGEVEWSGPGYDVALAADGRATWAQSGGIRESWPTDEGAPPDGDGWPALYGAFLDAAAGCSPAFSPPFDLGWAAWLQGLAEAVTGAEPGTLVAVPDPPPSLAPASTLPDDDAPVADDDRGEPERWLALVLSTLRDLPATEAAMRAGGWPRPGPAPTMAATGWRQVLRRRMRRLPVSQATKTRLVALERRLRQALRPPPPASPGAVPAAGPPPPADLRGLTVGLVGWDPTMARFARLLAPFDCRVLVSGARPAAHDAVRRAGGRHASPGELLGSATVVVLGRSRPAHGPLGDRPLAQMRAGTVVVADDDQLAADPAALARRRARGDLRPMSAIR